jgi:F-type H+-transporting ATPase subunit alpha
MKLDYLQFIELEVFTRFGARLEPSMEAKIKRGRTLREILKQDRLAPLPIEADLAWLLAFNHGLFDGIPAKDIPGRLEELTQAVRAGRLTLEDPEEAWIDLVNRTLAARTEI